MLAFARPCVAVSSYAVRRLMAGRAVQGSTRAQRADRFYLGHVLFGRPWQGSASRSAWPMAGFLAAPAPRCRRPVLDRRDDPGGFSRCHAARGVDDHSSPTTASPPHDESSADGALGSIRSLWPSG